MAQVQGFLREDKATYGEKEVLKLLKNNLPKEYTVYVECPLHGKRIQRYPDFIVLTNYGVIILEVKDWVHVQEADKFHATILTRENKTREEGNPTNQVREYAFLLQDELKKIPQLLNDHHKLNVGWGYAVVFPNLKTITISKLRNVWGQEFVLNRDDLEPDRITSRLKLTVPKEQARSLTKQEIDYIRATINPTVLFEPMDKPAIILAPQQETIVMEPVTETEPEIVAKPVDETQQISLFEDHSTVQNPPDLQPKEEKDPYGDALAQSVSIRLIRGVAGSGKTLVLTRRAQYLAAMNPEWKIRVLTFNNELASHLQDSFKGYPNVKVRTFHKFCQMMLAKFMQWKEPVDPKGWIAHFKAQLPAIDDLGVDFLAAEFSWICEVNISSLDEYLGSERKGRGTTLQPTKRRQVFEIYEQYRDWLSQEKLFDWADIPYLVLKGMDEGKVVTNDMDAILIDEAQDFAPVWFTVLKRKLKLSTGLLFLADDPSQSIYRYYSWREKGVPVVGRTRWLRIPYRNTREIYKAAYEVIREDDILKRNLEEQGGLIIEPDITDTSLRSGERPQIHCFPSFDAELLFIKMEVSRLIGAGTPSQEIAVLHRRKSTVLRIEKYLKGLNVVVDTFHALKGLEFEAVFLSQIQETFNNPEDATPEQISTDRRLIYMTMTRARNRLYLNHEGRWPKPLQGVQAYADTVLV